MKYKRLLETLRGRKFLKRCIAEVKSWYPDRGYGFVQILRCVDRSKQTINHVPLILKTTPTDTAEKRPWLLFMHRSEIFHEGIHPNVKVGMQVELTPDHGSSRRMAHEVTLPGLKKLAGKSFDASRDSSCAPNSWVSQNIQCRHFPKENGNISVDVDD